MNVFCLNAGSLKQHDSNVGHFICARLFCYSTILLFRILCFVDPAFAWAIVHTFACSKGMLSTANYQQPGVECNYKGGHTRSNFQATLLKST